MKPVVLSYAHGKYVQCPYYGKGMFTWSKTQQKPCHHRLCIIIFYDFIPFPYEKLFLQSCHLKSKGYVRKPNISTCVAYKCAVLGTAEPAWHPCCSPTLPFPLLTSPYKSCVRLLPTQLFRDCRSQGIWSAIQAKSTCSFHATIFQPLQLKSCHK